MQQQRRILYPFSALVGQDTMKKALLLNAINPKIGGVLVRGEKGTAKSLAVRGLAQLLPDLRVVSGCPFLCDPENPETYCDSCREASSEVQVETRQVSVIELPLGATEDRVIGTIDIESALQRGEKRFEPGILAATNRGILYIDEVNLLEDHLVDVLLDAAAMGRNSVEREGMSFSHPSEFLLVGTMNPEEGDLRPQLLDRFGLAVEVQGLPDKEARKEVVKRRIAFEADPPAFLASWQEEQHKLQEEILRAKVLLPEVILEDALLDLISQLCTDFAVDGHRADIVIYKTASTLAAYHGRREVLEEDVKEAAELALLHRRRRRPFEEPQLEEQQLQQSIQNWQQKQSETQGEGEGEGDQDHPFDQAPPEEDSGEGDREQVFERGEPYPVRPMTFSSLDQLSRNSSGRRSKSRTDSKRGRYVASALSQGLPTDIALDATLRAAAPYQLSRRAVSDRSTAVLIEPHDLREKVREKKVGNLLMFLVDGSGSMGVQERMVATKSAIFSLLLDAYQRRDKVGMMLFRSDRAEVVLPPTNNVEQAQRYLENLPTGGKTPLACGLMKGLSTIKEYLGRERHALPLLILVSDGRANVSLRGGDPVEEAKAQAREIHAAGIRSLAIDTERDFVSFGLISQICQEMGGTYLKLEELRAEAIASAVMWELN